MIKFNKFMPNIQYMFGPIFISSFTLAGLFLCDSGPIGPFWRFPKTDQFVLYFVFVPTCFFTGTICQICQIKTK